MGWLVSPIGIVAARWLNVFAFVFFQEFLSPLSCLRPRGFQLKAPPRGTLNASTYVRTGYVYYTLPGINFSNSLTFSSPTPSVFSPCRECGAIKGQPTAVKRAGGGGVLRFFIRYDAADSTTYYYHCYYGCLVESKSSASPIIIRVELENK